MKSRIRSKEKMTFVHRQHAGYIVVSRTNKSSFTHKHHKLNFKKASPGRNKLLCLFRSINQLRPAAFLLLNKDTMLFTHHRY